MATWNGLEPSTSSVTGWHSNQLNYQAIFNGGRNRARTYDPLLVRQVLSQLSYTPSHPFTTRELLYYTRARPECQVFFHNFFKFFRSSFSFRVFLSRTVFILTQVLIFVNNFFNFFKKVLVVLLSLHATACLYYHLTSYMSITFLNFL